MMQLSKNDKRILKAFFKFLKDNNALNEYKINTINNVLRRNKIEAYDEGGYMEYTSLINAFMPLKFLETSQYSNNPYIFYYNLINYAFAWSETPQKHRFWKTLNNEWVDTLKTLYNDNDGK